MAAAKAGPDMGTRRGPVRACPAKGSRGRSSTPSPRLVQCQRPGHLFGTGGEMSWHRLRVLEFFGKRREVLERFVEGGTRRR